ncbi:hypothetical protein OVA13_14720 [Pseudoxanthomonas sp. SL93]|uniref:hypothetical protein n=1 Tax=Pseudoxanthomonas sp. SL93 TaxID=2995142 RepID=UPI002271D369|nr:hypothetical protein [Pseudoxanthomonas sp. SL93]WAC62631.1 hypothetical protein OVA13_14720 [Pseudoxanthomonas sp. SL93]
MRTFLHAIALFVIVFCAGAAALFWLPPRWHGWTWPLLLGWGVVASKLVAVALAWHRERRGGSR